MKLSLDDEVYSSWPYFNSLSSWPYFNSLSQASNFVTWQENRTLEFVSGVKLSLLGGCVIKVLEGAPSARVGVWWPCSARSPALWSFQVWSWQSCDCPGGFSSALVSLMVSWMPVLAHKVPNPAAPGSVCKDTAGHMIKGRFRRAQRCKLLSLSRLSLFFFSPWHLFSSLLSSLTGGSCAAESRGEKCVDEITS